QNIPIRTEEGAKIRETFVPEAGNVLLAADYSQIELRLLAHIAGIPQLKQAFADGIDIHALTASEMFGVPVEGMDPLVRRQAKAINFGIIYGISAFGLAKNLGIERGEAADYIERYFERFPGIKTYMNQTKLFAREKGYVETLFGRRTHTPSIRSNRQNERGFAERAAINAPIQGTAADIIRRAMVRIEPALEAAGLESAEMLLQVHDELVFEVPASDADAAGRIIADTMESACAPVLELDVPLVVDIGTGATWGEAH
ncbi:MAG: DNA polymerase, partial [Pseudomonadota bacterium]